MKARYKWPGGTGIITLSDDASLEEVVAELKTKTLMQTFGIRYGPPIAMKAVDMTDLSKSAKLLGLHGETLTIVPNEADLLSTAESAKNLHAERSRPRKPESSEVNVPWPKRDGTLCKIHR